MSRNGALLRMPENVEFVEQRRVAGLGGIPHLHAVVNEGHAVQREHERRTGERAAQAVARDGAGLIVVVRDAGISVLRLLGISDLRLFFSDFPSRHPSGFYVFS